MVLDVRNRLLWDRAMRSRSKVAFAALGGAAALAGCGTAAKHAAVNNASADPPGGASCATAALSALGHVAMHVYHEGVVSERTAIAMRGIENSAPLRLAVEAGDATAARSAAQALIATGRLTALRLSAGGRLLADVGQPAVAPLAGTLTSAGGKPLASVMTSVWSDRGLVAETSGITDGTAILRTVEPSGHGRTVAGAFKLPDGHLPPRGTLTHAGRTYQFTSHAVEAYPSGRLREYVLRSTNSIPPYCGASAEDTIVNVLSRIARKIYNGESGGRTVPQIRRVQRNRALLSAVAHRDRQAARAAIVALLTQHIVRLRVSTGEQLLSDVGGPFVLAPVQAPLQLGGRTIGSLLLSIQDDEGYKRLAGRLAGLDSVIYMGSRLVKSTIGLSPGSVPTSGPFSYRGRSYRNYTFYGKAFPSGPLRITVLIPIPYS